MVFRIGLTEKVPHFSTFGKNYSRRFEGTDIFEQIFTRILEECIKNNPVKPKEIFVDATHVKACANSKKYSKEAVHKEALFYEEQLEKEIGIDREKHGNDSTFSSSQPIFALVFQFIEISANPLKKTGCI